MYETWLAMNIAWELALKVWPMLAIAGLALATAWTWACTRATASWRRTLLVALGIGVAAALVGMWWLPVATQSSWAEVAYWADWLPVLGIGAGLGAVVTAFVWPLAAAWHARD